LTFSSLPTLGAHTTGGAPFEQILLDGLGTPWLCSIGTELVQDFLNARKDQGLSWWSRNDPKGIVSGVFTTASDWAVGAGEIAALINELPGILQLMAAIAVSIGMRVSELCDPKWGSVDLTRGDPRATGALAAPGLCGNSAGMRECSNGVNG
jgi:integrase